MSVDVEELYDLVIDAVKTALTEELGSKELQILPRLEEGTVTFTDGTGKEFRKIPAKTLFKKITAVRERLRVLEQKLNNHPSLSESERAELQALVSRCYGTLTTFNFMFHSEADKMKS